MSVMLDDEDDDDGDDDNDEVDEHGLRLLLCFVADVLIVPQSLC